MNKFVKLLVFALFVSNVQSQEKPNILWIVLEDVSRWFSTYGDTVISTPNIDDLATSGLKFTRFYTPAGVCSATRSAMITGMMQTTIGAHQHRSARHRNGGKYFENTLPDSIVPIPTLFKNAGYWVFNEGGKNDFNFKWSSSNMYDLDIGSLNGSPSKFLAGDMLAGKPSNAPFFGMIQLKGGKNKGAPTKVSRNSVPIPPYYPDISEVRESIADHYDALLLVDTQVKNIVQYLKDNNLFDNTIIVLFSDHGMELHREKQYLYEGGIKMPLILSGPNVPSAIRHDLVSGIDVSATSLALAGIEIPSSMEGRNFMKEGYVPREYVIAARDRCDFTTDRVRAVITNKYKYLKNYFVDRDYMQPSYKDSWSVSKKFRQMMANDQMNATQLVFFGKGRPAEELYDLEKDPFEINNLAADPVYSDVLKEHRRTLENWIRVTDDKGQYPEPDIEMYWGIKDWDERANNSEYDFAKGKSIDELWIKYLAEYPNGRYSHNPKEPIPDSTASFLNQERNDGMHINWRNDHVHLELPYEGFADIHLYNVQGKQISSLHSGFLKAGVHRFQLQELIASGPFVLRIKGMFQEQSYEQEWMLY